MDSYQSAAVAREDLAKRRKRGNPTQAGRSIASDDLSSRMATSGLIQPGSHPELDVDTPLDKISRFLGKFLKPKKQASK